MDIAEALKFVKGGVAGSSSLLTEMTHYAIEEGHVRSFNGILCISSPIDFPFDCYPKADKFGTALGKCDADVMSLHLTANGRLRVQSGKFTAYIPTVDGPVPHPKPSGTTVAIDGAALLDAFNKLLPFIGNDASRPWSNGILFKGASAYATNNVIAAEYWIGVEFPPLNVPLKAIKEVVRVDKHPYAIQYDDNSVSFLYEDDRWIKTQLLDIKWPDIESMFARMWKQPDTNISEDLMPGLEAIKPFLDNTGWVYFRDGCLATLETDEDGAHYEVDGLPDRGCYKASMLLLLKDTATHIDLDGYPAASWAGDRIRGLIAGQAYAREE